MSAGDNSGQTSAWQVMGTWTAGSVAQPPVNVSVTPSSGSGLAQTFVFKASSSNGYQNLSYVQMIFSNPATSAAYCLVDYLVGSNTVLVNNDNGSGWVGSGVLGSAGTVENSQCRVTLGTSSALGVGATLTINLAITFKAGLQGQENILMSAGDNSGQTSAWQVMGTWTAGSVAQSPVNVSVTPSSGSGLSQSFGFKASSSNGYQNLSYVQMIFSNPATSAAYCLVDYLVGSNTVLVNNDNGSGWVGSGVLGSAGTVENSQCRVTLGTSSASGVGTTLTINLAITFKTGLQGQENILMSAGDNSGQTSAWQVMGTWTAQ